MSSQIDTSPLKDSWGESHRRIDARELKLEVVEGPDTGKSAVVQGTAVVGSHREVSLPLTDVTVSRQHLSLTPLPNGIALKDLGSRNGTFVGGVRVQQAMLGDSSQLTLGKTVLRVSRELAPLDREERFGPVLGRAPRMRELFVALERLAPTDTTLVLRGEAGTGKRFLAKTIHEHSWRASGPWVTLHADTQPLSVERHLAEASGGTVLLEGVDELPLPVQQSLLRGWALTSAPPFRVLATCRQELAPLAQAGSLDADLWRRLPVLLEVPPLRERREDTARLARHFVLQLGRPEFQLSPLLLEHLLTYAWPGNVAELRSFVERALAGAGTAPLETSTREELTFKEAKERLLDAFTREYLTGLLEKTGGNVSEMARLSGLNRSHVHALLNRHSLREE